MNIPEKALKCLNLALNDSATEGEWNSAAIRFCAILRRDRIGIEVFIDPLPKFQAPPKAKRTTKQKPKKPVMPFGKFKGMRFRDLPDWYVDWLFDQDFVSPELRAEIKRDMEGTENGN